MKKYILIFILLICPTLTNADCTQTEGVNTGNVNSVGYTGQQYGGQSFVADCTGDVDLVTVGLTNQRGGANWEVRFYSDAAGQPNTLLGTSNANSLTGVICPDATTFTFASPVTLTNGTTYWLVETNNTTSATLYADACGSNAANTWGYSNTVTALANFSGENYFTFVIEGAAPGTTTVISVGTSTMDQIQTNLWLAYFAFFFALVFVIWLLRNRT